jgi:hypothetical protein
MPAKTVALHIPLDALFSENGAAGSYFSSVEDIYARGEEIIAERMADGMSEVQARSTDASVDISVPIHAQVICRGKGLLHTKYYEIKSTVLPFEVRFEGVEMPVHGRVDQASHLAIPEGVTEASLIVLPDLDECVLHVNGTLASDSGTDLDVAYRILDSYGQGSQIFYDTIEAGQPLFVTHAVDMPVDDSELDGPGLLNPQGGHGDFDADQYAVEDTDLIQGTFQIEVISPNVLLSNVDGFSVEPGTCTPETVFEPAGQDFAIPSRPRN